MQVMWLAGHCVHQEHSHSLDTWWDVSDIDKRITWGGLVCVFNGYHMSFSLLASISKKTFLSQLSNMLGLKLHLLFTSIIIKVRFYKALFSLKLETIWRKCAKSRRERFNCWCLTTWTVLFFYFFYAVCGCLDHPDTLSEFCAQQW